VVAPRNAAIGQTLPLRIHVGWLATSTRLCADLHWSTNRDTSNNFLASGGSRAISRAGGTFDFAIPVPARPGLRYVHGIIYLSPTGNWEDHTRVVSTDLIPVTTRHLDGTTALAPVSLNQPDATFVQSNARLSSVLRRITALLLLAAAVLAVRNYRPTPGPARGGWLVLAIGLVLAAAWECFGWENFVGNLGRALLRAEDAYYSRKWFQRLAISATVAAVVVLVRGMWRQPWPQRWALIFFGLYLAVAAVNALSLHALDQYAWSSWRGILLVDGVKFLIVAAVLASVLHAGGRPRTARPAAMP